MAISAKKFASALTVSVCIFLQAETAISPIRAINTDNADLAFREILIEKSLTEKDFSCTVVRKNFADAIKSLQQHDADIVLFKDDGNTLKNLPQDLCFMKFAETDFIVFTSSRNPLKKLKMSDLAKIWNEDITHWKTFDSANVFTIHRFGMNTNDSAFAFLQKILHLKEKSQHFPLDSSAQIITMVRNNPNAIGIAVMDSNLDLQGINIVQITDENGKNITLNIPHIAICRIADKDKIAEFLKIKKD